MKQAYYIENHTQDFILIDYSTKREVDGEVFYTGYSTKYTGDIKSIHVQAISYDYLKDFTTKVNFNKLPTKWQEAFSTFIK